MADTTTMGWRSTCALTMEVTRATASWDSTEVPPNFITIKTTLPHGRGSVCGSLVEKTFRGHELGVEDGGSGGSANGVVATGYKLDVEHWAFAHAAHEDTHTVFARGIAARLR